MTAHRCHLWLSSVCGVVLMASFLALSGCASGWPQAARTQQQAAVDTTGAEMARLKDALTAFRGQDYATAQDLFERLSLEAQDQAVRRQALFGLACVRLVQAQSAEQMKRALNTWTIWEEQRPPENTVEDPRLLTPILKRLLSLLERPSRVEVRQAKPASGATSPDVAKILEEKDREIEALTHRLRALESIHRELEEKKRSLKD